MTLTMGLPGFVKGWPAIRRIVNSEFAALMDSLAERAPAAITEYSALWADVGVSAPEEGTERSGTERR